MTETHNRRDLYGVEALGKAMADLRKRFAPDPKDPNARPSTCERCGDVFYRWVGRGRKHCPDCAAEIQADTQRSMIERRGEHYEKMVRKQLKHWRSEAKRLGIR